jgi:hypothetical protein
VIPRILKTVNDPRGGASRGCPSLPSHNAKALPVTKSTKQGVVAEKAAKYAARHAVNGGDRRRADVHTKRLRGEREERCDSQGAGDNPTGRRAHSMRHSSAMAAFV